MLTSKQRANLRSFGVKIEPSFQIGKEEIGENQLEGLKQNLEKRELIKISVLKTSELSARESADYIAKKLNAEVVEVKGSKILLYKRSKNEKITHIEF